MISGRIDLTRRALERTIAACAASALGVERRDVAVRLADDGGELSIQVEAPVTTRAGSGLVTRAAGWRTEVRGRSSELTGLVISTVHVHLTSLAGQKGRVR